MIPHHRPFMHRVRVGYLLNPPPLAMDQEGFCRPGAYLKCFLSFSLSVNLPQPTIDSLPKKTKQKKQHPYHLSAFGGCPALEKTNRCCDTYPPSAGSDTSHVFCVCFFNARQVPTGKRQTVRSFPYESCAPLRGLP